jgi:predicted MFS family arabinose efflux permease
MNTTGTTVTKSTFGGRDIYAAVLLCLINFFLFADQNLMAPNLTKIAHDFGMSDLDRDMLLGGRIAMGFWLLGGIVTLFTGYLTDRLSRKRLLLAVVLIGELPCFLTGFAQNYPQMFVLRALTGIGLGGVLPLTNSLLGDMFPKEHRAKAFGLIGVAAGLGIAVGQMVAGFTTDSCLGTLCGWRIPFVVVAAPGFLVALLYWLTTSEPSRGKTEESLKKLIDSGRAYTAKINWAEYRDLFRNRTNILLILQTLPGIVPWSVLFIYLNDFLSQEKGYSVQAATTICMVLGVGILAGIAASGFIGDRIFRKSPKMLAWYVGISILAGIVPTLMIFLYPSQAGAAEPDYTTLTVLSLVTGFIIAQSGANCRAILVNVNLPEARGSMSSFFNIVDDLGRGFGPFFVSLFIAGFGRETAFIITPFFWVPCGLIFFLIGRTLPADVDALDGILRERAVNMTAAPVGKTP